LQHLKLESCAQIRYVFPSAVAEGLNQLQYLEISNCESIEAIIGDEGNEIEDALLRQQTLSHNGAILGASQTRSLFHQLQTLKLITLKNKISLSQPWYLLNFLSLKHVTLLSCPRLKKLPFGPKSVQTLIEIKAERRWLEELEFEDTKTKLALERCLTGNSHYPLVVYLMVHDTNYTLRQS